MRCFKRAVEALRHVPHLDALGVAQEIAGTAPPPPPLPAAATPSAPLRSPTTRLPRPRPSSLQPILLPPSQVATGRRQGLPRLTLRCWLKRPPQPVRTHQLHMSAYQVAEAFVIEPRLPASLPAGGNGTASPPRAPSPTKPAAKAPPAAAARAPTQQAPMQGLDAPAAQVAMHNLQGALRHAFALGAPPPRLLASHHHLRSATARPSTAPTSTSSSSPALLPDHPLSALRARRHAGALSCAAPHAAGDDAQATPVAATATTGRPLASQLPRPATAFAAGSGGGLVREEEGGLWPGFAPAQAQVRRDEAEVAAWASRKDALR